MRYFTSYLKYKVLYYVTRVTPNTDHNHLTLSKTEYKL